MACDSTQYTVKTGDTLTGIAHNFYGSEGSPADLSREVADIARINHITNPNLIHTGDQLLIPGIINAQSLAASGGESALKNCCPLSFGESVYSAPAPTQPSLASEVYEDTAIGAGLGLAVGAVGGLGIFDEVTIPIATAVGAAAGAVFGVAKHVVDELF